MLFKILSISHGWFDIDINRQFVLVNSDYLGCDAPALLLEALGNLMEQTQTVQWLCWQDEPGAYILKLERNDDKLIGRVYDTDTDSFGLDYSGMGLANEAKECVFVFEEKILKAVTAIYEEFNLYEKGNGRLRYLRHWGDFPDKEYGRIKMLLHQSNYAGSPPDGKLNGYQKKFFRLIAGFQEEAVQKALAQYESKEKIGIEDILYDATYSVITDIMGMIDGYRGFSKDEMDLVNRNTGLGLKENPFIELQDSIADFIKYEK